MTNLPHSAMIKSIASEESWLFFKQWLRSPLQLGTFAPISLKLAHLAADQLCIKDDTIVVEIGAGTGRLTRSLLAKGVTPNKLAVVELDVKMSNFLEASLKKLYQSNSRPIVIQGNAEELPSLIPSKWIGKVDYVVSVIPLMYMEEAMRERIIQAAIEVLNPKTGSILHITYSPASPVKFMEGELLQKRVVSLWGNMPPGFVWSFTPKRYLHKLS